jgi:hypothetical protein
MILISDPLSIGKTTGVNTKLKYHPMRKAPDGFAQKVTCRCAPRLRRLM